MSPIITTFCRDDVSDLAIFVVEKVFQILYSLLPIDDPLLWGPADALHYEKSAGF